MKEFFKDYFLSFFSQKHAKNIYKRSFLITFVNVILLFILLFVGVYEDQHISFSYHFKNSENFNQLLDDAFTNSFVIKDGVPEYDLLYNSYKDDSNNYNALHYEVIIDTRDKETTYEDFDLKMTTEDGNEEITYESYLLLNEEEKSNYHAVVTRTGNYLDTTLHVSEYENYLSSRENNSYFLKLQESYNQGSISLKKYADLLYVEYSSTYYPSDVTTFDTTGDMPTMYSYYCSLIDNDFSDRDFLFVYGDGLEASFTHNDNHFTFFGIFEGDKEYNFETNKKDAINSFIIDSYNAGKDYRMISCGAIACLVWFALIILLTIYGFITRFFLRLKQRNVPHYLVKILNLHGSFILWSSIFSVICGGFAGFFISREALILLISLLIPALIIVRSVIYYVIEKNPSDYIADDL